MGRSASKARLLEKSLVTMYRMGASKRERSPKLVEMESFQHYFEGMNKAAINNQ